MCVLASLLRRFHNYILPKVPSNELPRFCRKKIKRLIVNLPYMYYPRYYLHDVRGIQCFYAKRLTVCVLRCRLPPLPLLEQLSKK